MLEDKNYSIVEMKEHIDSLNKGIYPTAIEYLTDKTKPDSRHLKLETLQKFKVGVGKENFLNEISGKWESLEVVYFPMYAPVESEKHRNKNKQKLELSLDSCSKSDSYKLEDAHNSV